MSGKTILVTGSTDGIGLETAQRLVVDGHDVVVHGRDPAKLERVRRELAAIDGGRVDGLVADLSSLDDVEALAASAAEHHAPIDVLINNAGVFRTAAPRTSDGLDVRFVVNTIAPYLLTTRLLPRLGSTARVINLSSAAQAPVDLAALAGDVALSDDAAYAQSKLAITAWSVEMARRLGTSGPVVVAVNPGSLLATRMVKEAYGMDGADVGIGAEILVQAALSEEFEGASGAYFDNDAGRFASPHADALKPSVTAAVVDGIESILADLSHPVGTGS